MLFCLFGSQIIDKANVDFALFGPRPLAVFLFGVLFPLYGVFIVSMAERFLRPAPAVLSRPFPTAAGYLLLSDFGSFGLFHTVVAVNTVL